MTKLVAYSRVIAADVRRVEKSITVAMRDAFELGKSLTDASLELGFAADVGHRAIAELSSSIGHLSQSRHAIVQGAHRDLAGVAKKLGLDETAWGAGEPKKAELKPIVQHRDDAARFAA